MGNHHVGLRILASIVLLVSCVTAAAQLATGEWRAYPAFHDATKSVRAFTRIYVLSEGSLYYYSPSDNSVRTYDKVTTLSDSNIADMVYCSAEKAILLCYSNGNIDFLYADDDIYNVTDLKNSTLPDKTVHEVRLYGNKAYISTNSGIIQLDISKKVISETYRATDVYSSVILDNTLFYTNEEGIWKGSLADNLLDSSKWTLIEDRTQFLKLYSFDNCLLAVSRGKGLFNVKYRNKSISLLETDVLHHCICDSRLFVYEQDTLKIFSSLDSFQKYFTDCTIKDVIQEGNSFWVSCGNDGLQKCSIKDNNIVFSKTSIIPDSPQYNYFDFMNIINDEKLLVAGGSLNYTGRDYEGTLMYMKDNTWYNFQNEGIGQITGLPYINITSVAEDPKQSEHYYAGSARHGLYEFFDRKFHKLWTFDNSPLETILPNDRNPYDYVSVDGLQYDYDGNLWMFNNEVDTIIRIMKPDGSWTSLYYPEIAGMPSFKQFLFDSNGMIWTASTFKRPGLFCFDTNGTLEDASDDRHAFSGSTFTNQDGVAVTINQIYFIEKDLDGMMWIGTDKGIFTLDSPESFLTERSHTFRRIKVPRNDGTNTADYLLSNVYTTAICVDFGNRKWIGTMNNGLFLIDRDNITTLRHFTTDNSPLISNSILNIKANGETGEVYIGTDEGLIIYGSDAVRAKETLKKSNVTVYPNPVLPEYENMVTFKGFSNNCTIKILNQSGRVVHEGISNGGAYSWNCSNGNGRVPSGVYFVMAIDEDQSTSIVARFVVIR